MTAQPLVREQDGTAVWEDTLDALERAVQAAARLAARPGSAGPLPAPTAWVPPVPDGPLPPALLDRARDLLRRQAEVSQDLARAAARTRAELAGLDRPAPVAAYVDVSA